MTPRSREILGAGRLLFRGVLSLPFGSYKDFAACVAANQDKENPEGFCAELHRKITGEYPGAKKSWSLSRDEVAKLCPSCAEKMDARGWTVLKIDPEHASPSLAAAILKVTDPGFFRHCMSDIAPKTNVDDPEAFCASLHEKLTGIWPGEHASEKRLTVAKVDDDRQLVFGWASVSLRKDGMIVLDKQGDMIAPDVLEDAAYDFVLQSREGDEMHTETVKAHLVESFFSTPEKLAKMGVPDGFLPTGWWVGFHVEDPATFAKVKSGHYPMFSIGGTGLREAA